MYTYLFKIHSTVLNVHQWHIQAKFPRARAVGLEDVLRTVARSKTVRVVCSTTWSIFWSNALGFRFNFDITCGFRGAFLQIYFLLLQQQEPAPVVQIEPPRNCWKSDKTIQIDTPNLHWRYLTGNLQPSLWTKIWNQTKTALASKTVSPFQSPCILFRAVSCWVCSVHFATVCALNWHPMC